jgi:hypothetical protein
MSRLTISAIGAIPARKMRLHEFCKTILKACKDES